ncbi:MAG: hypothetical protein ACRCSY_08530 [Cetobacterium sp.]
MKCVKSSSDEMFSHTKFLDVLDTVLPFGMERGVAKAFISRPPMSCWKIISEDGELLGFYTLEKIGGCVCEAHAYVFPDKRQSSIKFLKHIIKHVEEMGLSTYTSVTGDFIYIVRLLKMLGFEETGREVGVVQRNSGSYDLIQLTKWREY